MISDLQGRYLVKNHVANLHLHHHPKTQSNKCWTQAFSQEFLSFLLGFATKIFYCDWATWRQRHSILYVWTVSWVHSHSQGRGLESFNNKRDIFIILPASKNHTKWYGYRLSHGSNEVYVLHEEVKLHEEVQKEICCCPTCFTTTSLHVDNDGNTGTFTLRYDDQKLHTWSWVNITETYCCSVISKLAENVA